MRHGRHHHVIVIACKGWRERSGWVRTRDGRGGVVMLLLLLLHVRVGKDKV